MGEQYLSDFVDKNDPKPPKYPLNMVMCKNCTLVQLKETTPPDQLYTARYGYRSGISNTIKNDLKEIVTEVVGNKLKIYTKSGWGERFHEMYRKRTEMAELYRRSKIASSIPDSNSTREQEKIINQII